MGVPRQGLVADPILKAPAHDQRLLVLLVVGLLISLQHLPLLDHQTQNHAAGKASTFVWLETASRHGLFRVSRDRPYSLSAVDYSLQAKASAANLPQTFQFAPLHAHFLLTNRPPFMTPLLPAEIEPLLFQPLTINEASVEQLATIPGVGEHTAQKIVAYRNRVGRIKGIADLSEVNGLGVLRAAKLHDYVRY